jgi:hypothetical protein
VCCVLLLLDSKELVSVGRHVFPPPNACTDANTYRLKHRPSPSCSHFRTTQERSSIHQVLSSHILVIMSSGVGVKGTLGRCYPFYADVKKCVVCRTGLRSLHPRHAVFCVPFRLIVIISFSLSSPSLFSAKKDGRQSHGNVLGRE